MARRQLKKSTIQKRTLNKGSFLQHSYLDRKTYLNFESQHNETRRIWIDASAVNQILRVPRHRSDVKLFYRVKTVL